MNSSNQIELKSQEEDTGTKIEYNSKFLVSSCLCIILSSVIYGEIHSGYETGLINITAFKIMKLLEWDTNASTLIAISNLSLCTGGVVGSCLSGKAMNSFGRRGSLMRVNLLMVLSIGINIIPYTPSFIIGRMMTGACCGIYSVIPLIFITEISPKKLKAKFGTLIQISITLGVFICFIVSTITDYYLNNLSNYMAVLTFPAVFLALQSYLFAKFFNFDSPIWLIQNDKHAEAEVLIKKIYKSCSWQMRLRSMEGDEVVRKTSINLNNTKIVLKNPKILSCLLFVFQQFSGIYIFLYYSKVIFKDFESSEDDFSYFTVIFGGINFLASIPNLFLVNLIPRKTVLTLGLFSMSACNCLLYVLTRFSEDKNIPYLVVVVYIIFDLIYETSVGSIVWVYLTEILGVCWIGTAITVRWVCSAVNITIFPLFILDNISDIIQVYFLLCSAICFLGGTLVLWMATPVKGFSEFKSIVRTITVRTILRANN